MQIKTTVDEGSVLLPYAQSIMPSEDGMRLEAIVNIPVSILKELDVDIRIDITPTTPFNKLTQQQKLDNLLISQNLTFDEYVKALPDDEPLKPKLEDIVERRAEQQAMQMGEMQNTIAQQDQIINQQQQQLESQQGQDLTQAVNDAYFMAAIDAAASSGKES